MGDATYIKESWVMSHVVSRSADELCLTHTHILSHTHTHTHTHVNELFHTYPLKIRVNFGLEVHLHKSCHTCGMSHVTRVKSVMLHM